MATTVRSEKLPAREHGLLIRRYVRVSGPFRSLLTSTTLLFRDRLTGMLQ